MLHFSPWKIAIILAACMWAITLALPNFLPNPKDLPEWLPSKTINLGLDLRGGSHLLLEIDFDTYLSEQLETLVADTRLALRTNNIGYKNLGARENAVHFTVRDPSHTDIIPGIIKDIAPELNIDIDNLEAQIQFSEKKLDEMRLHVLEQSIEIGRPPRRRNRDP